MLAWSRARRRPLLVLGLTSALVLFSIVLLTSFGSQRPEFGRLATAIHWNSDESEDDHEVPALPSHCVAESSSTSSPPKSSASSDTSRAAALAPKDLLCRNVDTKAVGVPKLFHQSWKSTELPTKFERWSETCRTKHSDWEWVLWTDDDNLALVQTYFPWLEDTYLALPGVIYQADFARNLYMYMYGGVYADLDVECIQSTSEVLDYYLIPTVDEANQTSEGEDSSPHDTRSVAAFGRMGGDDTFDESIPNAWMASSPRHPFFYQSMKSVQEEVEASKSWWRKWVSIPSPENMTGPIALRKNILRWQDTFQALWHDLVVFPPDVIYPFNWREPEGLGHLCFATSKQFDGDKCKDRLGVRDKGSLTITYWSHTHNGTEASDSNIDKISHVKQ